MNNTKSQDQAAAQSQNVRRSKVSKAQPKRSIGSLQKFMEKRRRKIELAGTKRHKCMNSTSGFCEVCANIQEASASQNPRTHRISQSELESIDAIEAERDRFKLALTEILIESGHSNPSEWMRNRARHALQEAA